MKKCVLILLVLTSTLFAQITVFDPLNDVLTLMNPCDSDNRPIGSPCHTSYPCTLRWVGMIGNDSLIVRIEEFPEDRMADWETLSSTPKYNSSTFFVATGYRCRVGDLALIKKSAWDMLLAEYKKHLEDVLRAEVLRLEEIKRQNLLRQKMKNFLIDVEKK